MKDHRKKMIAPIVVTILMVAYFVLYFTLVIRWLDGLPRILFGAVPAVFTAVMIGVCIQRIKEIRSGEEDDLGKY
jgi:hypothetical protein